MQRRQKESKEGAQCPESLWRRWPGGCGADPTSPGLSEVKREGQRSRPAVGAPPSLPPVAREGCGAPALPCGLRGGGGGPGLALDSETSSRSGWARLLTDHPSPLPWALESKGPQGALGRTEGTPGQCGKVGWEGWKGPGRKRYCVVQSEVGVRMYWERKLEKLAGGILERVKEIYPGGSGK